MNSSDLSGPAPHTPATNGAANGAAVPLGQALAGALDWWRDAGIEGDFLDQATPWIASATSPEVKNQTPAIAAPPPPPKPHIGGETDGWPTTLADWPAWWLSEASLDESAGVGTGGGLMDARVPPRGPAGAAVMILIPQPEMDDAQTGALLSGRQGQLLAAMLAAMGISASDTYLASALPRHTPHADWAAIGAGGMGAVLRHHVGLARPKRLIAFGANILPLLGHDLTKNPDFLPLPQQRDGNGDAEVVPLLMAHDLGLMLDRAQAKAAFWRNWLGWAGQ